MSENKYIIDKDSLTGIADAVRNKLGNGDVGDDSAGYQPQEAIVGKFSTPSHTTTGAVTWTTCSISSQNYSLYFDKPFYQISVTGTFVVGNTFQLHANYATKNCASGNRTYIWTWTSPQTQLTLLSQSYDSSSYYSITNGYSSELTIVFKDQDGNALIPKTSSIQYVSGSTTNFLLGQVYLPVPFFIYDIQDKITNYLEKKSTIKTKLFIQRYSSSTTQAQYSKYANYLWANSTYNYNVGPSDLTYITTKIPNLRPENIIYMAVITANNNEKKYQFRSEIYPMQHYTTLSQSGSGKRLKTATDYYFFPNGCAFKTYSENYGLLAHWDKNNSILDLQGVQKSSGTINGTITASSSAYLNPYMLYIIYEEVTE